MTVTKPIRRLVVVFKQTAEYRFTIDTDKSEQEVMALLDDEPFDPEDYGLYPSYPDPGTFDVGRAVGGMEQDSDFVVDDQGLHSKIVTYRCTVCEELVHGDDLREHMVQHQSNARGIPFYVLLRMYEEEEER